MNVAVCRKRELFRIKKQSRNEEDRKKICEAKKGAKRVVYMGMDQESRKVLEKVDSCRDGRALFRIAKGLGKRQMLLGLVVLKMKVGR